MQIQYEFWKAGLKPRTVKIIYFFIGFATNWIMLLLFWAIVR